MTALLYDYPQSAAFGRGLPKSKIYAHAKPSIAIKELFVRQVEQIIWQFKLAPETINLTATRAIPEIQIIRITLKLGEIKDDVLHCIDQAVSFPIFFELCYEGKIQIAAAFKRPSVADKQKWVVRHYFKSGWLAKETPRVPLPVVLNLKALYEQLLTPLLPYPARQGENLQARVERIEQIRSKQNEILLCESRLDKEKQFNHKVAINTELRMLKQELDELTRTN